MTARLFTEGGKPVLLPHGVVEHDDDVRHPDDYPFSARPGTGVRECPICDAHIADAVYAIHWECCHPDESAHLRTVEMDPAALDRWADAGFPVAVAS